MPHWFLELEPENQIAIVVPVFLALAGVIWGGVKSYIKYITPKTTTTSVPPVPMVKMTLDDFENRMESRVAKAIQERDEADPESRKIINREIEILQQRLANSEESFETQKQFVTELEARLDLEANNIDGNDLAKAKKALEAGDTLAAERLLQGVKTSKAPDVEASARASFALGEIAEQDVRWNEANDHFSKAANLHPFFTTLIRAQKIALLLANYPEAERLGQLALTAAEKEYGKNQPQYSESLNNLAGVFYSTGRFDEAEAHFRHALENTRIALGEDHPDVGNQLLNLAGVLQATDRVEEAESLLRQALDNTRDTLGESHSRFSTCLNKLAGLLNAKGRFDEAEQLLRQALEISRKASGEHHPSFGNRLFNLAMLLRGKGRFEEAEPLFQQALEISRKALGEDHPDFGKCVYGLAGQFFATGRLEEAQALLVQAIGIFDKSLGADHTKTKTAKANLAALQAEIAAQN